MNNQCIILLSFLILIIGLNTASADFYESSDVRRAIYINNTIGDSVTDYQLKSVNLSSYEINASSARIVNETTQLEESFWNETVDANGNLEYVWANFSSIPTGSWTNSTYYIYYQTTPSVNSASDGDATFNLFDNFSGIPGAQLQIDSSLDIGGFSCWCNPRILNINNSTVWIYNTQYESSSESHMVMHEYNITTNTEISEVSLWDNSDVISSTRGIEKINDTFHIIYFHETSSEQNISLRKRTSTDGMDFNVSTQTILCNSTGEIWADTIKISDAEFWIYYTDRVNASHHDMYRVVVNESGYGSPEILFNDTVRNTWPKPKKFGDTYYIYYDKNSQGIYVRSSSDGVTFGSESAATSGAHNAPQVELINNTYYLIYNDNYTSMRVATSSTPNGTFTYLQQLYSGYRIPGDAMVFNTDNILLAEALSPENNDNNFFIDQLSLSQIIDTSKWDGNTGDASVSGGIMSFGGSYSSDYMRSISQFGTDAAIRTKMKFLNPTDYIGQFGFMNIGVTHFNFLNVNYVPENSVGSKDGTTSSYINSNIPLNSWKTIDIEVLGDTRTSWFYDGVEGTGSPKTSYPSNTADLEIFMAGRAASTALQFDWILVRKYTATPPEAWSVGDIEYDTDSTDPTYSKVNHNTTETGTSCLFSIQYNDNTALHTTGQYIFSTNNTGTWVNESAVNWTATPEYANVTKTLNSTIGTIIGYRWYADDNASNSNDTIIYTLTVTRGDYTPPNPTSLANTTGNFWVNYTWSPGSGNVTDSYNVSYNGTWDNSSSNAYRNESVGAHGYLNIIVYAYNSSGSGTLSASSLTDNVTVPNNVISISDVSASYTINEGETLSIDANYIDTDDDTGTFDDNSTVWNVDANTGIVSWVTSDGDDGTYNWYINVTDGYGSTSTQEFTVTVNDSIYTPELEEVSFSPSPFNTNYTGIITISYLVKSSEPLNLSSLAFVYGVNYTITSDMHNYIAAPSNDIAYDGIYRAPHRNLTPYLSWEYNTTITNNSVWQWGGYDNDSAELSTSVVNSTHTWVNVTGYTEDVLPSSFYISKTAMYDAPKTGFEINRVQGLIFKTWNVEELRNRNSNYFANLYFDTSWESTLPTYPIEIGFCNNSYNPSIDDIDTCPYCAKFGEWNGTRWVNHSFDPGVNASYASPLVINASLITSLSPDDVNYIWLRSYTISAKSYVLNATNHDPGITNITYAQTNTMWTYNELNGQTDAVAYTPSFFTTFPRDDEEMLHQLYVANNVGDWGQTGILSEEIGISSIPVPSVSFEHFNVSCASGYLNDTLMDATYDDGSMEVYIRCPADPDGGTVSHNLTLHYGNDTFVATINNTFTTTGNEYVTINFSTSSYYSSSDYYTLKCKSVDDEGSIATKWLVSNFTLDADGNQGHITNGKVDFWGMNNIPTLYTTVNNNSLISYNAGTDIYTMHVPFYKSKYNDTFNFNETVYLKSLNNEDVSYFRFTGDTVFDYANIHAWNTTSNTLAPVTDTHRGYVYSHLCTHGNITNSIFSYLGSDLYRQEGLNFIETTRDYLIHNTTFSNNAEGLIMENCANFTISNSTISNNVNVGIGIYFTNDTIVENNTISSNGGRGVSIYEGHNNTIKYNTITNSGAHGIHMWSNSQNNTCTGNDITGSTTYDYYLSSSSTENYIIDPASTTDKIRVTSTSSVNIENTDNTAFSEDSLNTSYAHLTNFSMYVSGVSQTFDITQHTATITPSTDKLSIWNLEWDNTLTFNTSSDTALNPTWYNVTNSSWANTNIEIYRNGTLYTTESADANGLTIYNYTDTYSEKYFEFKSVWASDTSKLYVGVKSRWIDNNTWTHIDTPDETDIVVTGVDFWGSTS